ncbi:MAG: AMP-binding protein, partial [Brevibacterium sp.]
MQTSNTAEAAVTTAFPVADLVGLPADRARSNPDGPCLSWPGGSYNNAEFASAVAATAHAMRSRFRIGYGSVVGVLLCNTRGVIVTMFATWSLGAVLNPIDPALSDEEVGFQLDDSGAVMLVGDTRAEVVADVHSLSFLSVDDDCYRGGAEPLRDLTVRDGDGSLIVYTSAATGPPKGCLLSHSNVSAM